MKDFIETRRTILRTMDEAENREWIQRQLLAKGEPLVSDWAPKGTVQAEINYGRWIIKCPRCPNAEAADPEWPLFVCTDCGQGPDGAIFPKDKAGIEAVLLLRPRPQNRTWLPHETLADLKQQNKENL